ncbi:MAG: fatty acyl-AMP ligase [Vicinamibacteria bacterium]
MREARTFIDVLRDRADSRLGLKGYTFLKDGAGLEQRLSYEELDRRARELGGVIAAKVAPRERVLLVFDAGLDYVVALFACFYAGVVAVPLYAPNPLKPEAGLDHIDRVALDCAASLGLTSAELSRRLPPLLAPLPFAGKLSWLDVAESRGEATAPLPHSGEEDVALLQYTSGSTSLPKGVMVTHRNLLHNGRHIREAFGISEEWRTISWLPHHHDMGLMGGIIEPLFLGIEMVLFSPQLFVQRPVVFLEAITRFRINGGGCPNFGYDLLTRRVSEAAREKLDLSSWRLAFCGAEPVRSATLEAFARAFAGCGFQRSAFLPCYGLAEATLLVTASPPFTVPREITFDEIALEEGRVAAVSDRGAASTRALVSCGRPPLGVRIAIVDPETGHMQPEDRVGEIWVKGPNVAKGYWGQAEATRSSFDARLETGEAGFLRTGDLGFIDGGELFVTGRLKDLIIIRGRNLYPQDVEATVEQAHDAVRSGRVAVFSIELLGEERLIVTCEVSKRGLADRDAIVDAVRSAVAAAHGVTPHDVALLEPQQLPRTSSGKPRRSLSRKQYLDSRSTSCDMISPFPRNVRSDIR